MHMIYITYPQSRNGLATHAGFTSGQNSSSSTELSTYSKIARQTTTRIEDLGHAVLSLPPGRQDRRITAKLASHSFDAAQTVAFGARGGRFSPSLRVVLLFWWYCCFGFHSLPASPVTHADAVMPARTRFPTCPHAVLRCAVLSKPRLKKHPPNGHLGPAT